MARENSASRLVALLKESRKERGISLRQLADEAGVNASVASRAEKGVDSRLSTWDKLFEALGYQLFWDFQELCEEAGDLLGEEAQRRIDRRTEGLCFGKRRFD